MTQRLGNGEWPRRVLFAGGGTGGHIYMGVAVGELLRRRVPEATVVFVGARGGLEERILPGLGYPLESFSLGGLKNVGAGRVLRTLLQLPFAFAKSLRLLRRLRPEVVVGLGGYSSGPVALAAAVLRIPVLLVEPNAFPGFTNRLLRPFATAVAAGFVETARNLDPERSVVTGVPIRQEFFAAPPADFTASRLTVLVFGGSRGSLPINRLVAAAAQLLRDLPLDWIHQTGRDHFAPIAEEYERHGLAVELLPYIENMPEYVARAHLLISRAGASTVAEIAAAGRPAVLIPFPAAADDHQTRNAEVLGRAGAAVVLAQSGLTPHRLAETIRALAADRARLAAMAAAAARLARRDAAEAILELIACLAARRSFVHLKTPAANREVREVRV
ncbi:MAG: undecaprenyldiphospho-muramoylpentapeptide beta-N-acetylglucosaminyltransferase [Acidobacteriota bacterium]